MVRIQAGSDNPTLRDTKEDPDLLTTGQNRADQT